jgi:hypothetical protein
LGGACAGAPPGIAAAGIPPMGAAAWAIWTGWPQRVHATAGPAKLSSTAITCPHEHWIVLGISLLLGESSGGS